MNGNPKIVAEVLQTMELSSTDWFLEAEVMLKARHLRLMVFEIEHSRIPARSQHRYVSGVPDRYGILRQYRRPARLGGPWNEWRKRVAASPMREVHTRKDYPDGGRLKRPR